MPVIDYKCPNCGSSMVFDSETGMLSCQSCGRQDNIEQLQDPLARSRFEEGEVNEYHCTSCGAVLMTEPETAATTCSFCGSSVVLGDRLTGKLAPVKVIPFKVSKEEAVQAFKKWCRNGRLTPNGFMTADRIKSITGMYVPFWLYDLHNDIEVEADATKVRTYVRGEYQITETDHYIATRDIVLNYVKVPIDASKKMDDELMDKLEPFPYDQLKGFKTPYLAGYVAERYNYDDEQLFPRAKEKIQEFVDAYIRSTLSGYATVHYRDKRIHTSAERADYVLLPVWILNYDYQKREYTFAMNGQTGKVVGKPPISKAKAAGWFGSIFAASFVVLKLVSVAMGGGWL